MVSELVDRWDEIWRTSEDGGVSWYQNQPEP